MNENMKLAKVQLEAKSLGLGVILTFFFGGLGLLYVSIPLGLVAAVIELFLWLTTFIWIGFILLPIAHVIFIIMAIVLIKQHNQKLLNSLADQET